jgi:hypothetical protein
MAIMEITADENSRHDGRFSRIVKPLRRRHPDEYIDEAK